jgi:hypothetical protein
VDLLSVACLNTLKRNDTDRSLWIVGIPNPQSIALTLEQLLKGFLGGGYRRDREVWTDL